MLTAFSALAEDLYFSQSGAGFHNGTAGNEWSVSETSSAVNWGAGTGKISAGDTLHIKGIITGSLTCQDGGTTGLPVTLLFDPDARFSAGAFPPSGAINCNGFSHITIDGGANGIIENTDNGSGLGRQQQSVGISAQRVNSLEVKRLTIRSIYLHTSNTDITTLDSPDGSIYFGHQTNVFIHDCVFSDAHWAVGLNFTYGSTREVTVSNCFFYNVDHGVSAGGYGSASYNLTNLYIIGNTFSNYANWDTTDSVYHHDGIHVFGKAGAVAQNIVICGNVFKGDIGEHQCTGHVYCEADDQGGTGGSGGYKIYNNLFLPPGNHGNFGTISGGGIGVCNGWVANNTIYGANVDNHYALRFSAGDWGFTNNIVIGAWSAASTYLLTGATLNCSFDHNLYVAIGGGGWNGNSWAAWNAANDFNSTNDAVSGLTATGLPLAGSPCIEAGANLSDFFTTDLAGNPRGSRWYIGAFQYISEPPPDTNPAIIITPTNLNFGCTIIGTTSNLSIKVQNTGGGTLTGDASTSDPFSIVSGGTYNLLAGQRQTVSVAFNPTTVGTSIQNISFTGASGAVAAAAGTSCLLPELSIMPINPNFGVIVVGNISNLSIAAQNAGDGTIPRSTSATVPFRIVSGGSLIVMGPGRSSTKVLNTGTSVIPLPPLATVLLPGATALNGNDHCPEGLQYRILTATNLALPLGNWTPVWTNIFSGAGDFAYTNSTTNASAYFRLVSP